MQEGAKRRLIGAAVVVALLVIFLPMLLEDEEDTLYSVSEREIAIPLRPDFDQDYDASVLNPPVEPSISTFPEYEDPMQEGSPPPQELLPPEFFETPATTKPERVPASDLVPSEETSPATKPKPAPEAAPTPRPKTPPAVKPKPTPKPKTLPAAKPKPTPKPRVPSPAKPKRAPKAASAPAQPSPDPSAWVIQIASLREYARAEKLVQNLRVKGFPAFIQEAWVKQKRRYRVCIGPELKHKDIKSVAADLRRKTGRKGQIRRYP